MSAISSLFSSSGKAAVGVAKLYNPRRMRERGWFWTSLLLLATAAVIIVILGIYWSDEPDTFNVSEVALVRAEAAGESLVPGYVTTSTLVTVAETLLNKPGGYLSNDVMPPGVYLDNMPSWEFGVLVQVRDFTRSMRNDFSRSQTQSAEDRDLVVAEPQFSFNNNSWILPSTESEYRKGIAAAESYLHRLADDNQSDAQFYSRADNLRDWLSQVEKRLGSLSQRLSAAVGESRLNIDLAGDRSATQSTPRPDEMRVQTPWLDIDNVFYQARGATWALLHFLRAIEIDFNDVLADKNAVVSLRQITRELESTQLPMWSPVILNGTGFGPLANHSLVMASYISRANAALIDLRSLLQQG